jgi:KaiC/GvpD/RAD55 family RecA-like ATPase
MLEEDNLISLCLYSKTFLRMAKEIGYLDILYQSSVNGKRAIYMFLKSMADKDIDTRNADIGEYHQYRDFTRIPGKLLEIVDNLESPEKPIRTRSADLLGGNLKTKKRRVWYNMVEKAANKLQDKLADDPTADVSSEYADLNAARTAGSTEGNMLSWDKVIDINHAEGAPVPLKTHMCGLDDAMPVYLGQIMAIAAPPGLGKTTFINQMCINILLDNPDMGAVYISLENMAPFTYRKFQTYLTGQGISNSEADEFMKRMDLHFCCELFDIDQILASIEQLKRDRPSIQVVFIDYIQLASAKYKDSLFERMEAVMLKILQFNKKHQMLIVLASQMDKTSIKSKFQGMDSAKGGMDLAQHSSYFITLSRKDIPKSTDPCLGADEGNQPQDIEMHIAKSRFSGAGRTLPLVLFGEDAAFYPLVNGEVAYEPILKSLA